MKVKKSGCYLSKFINTYKKINPAPIFDGVSFIFVSPYVVKTVNINTRNTPLYFKVAYFYFNLRN